MNVRAANVTKYCPNISLKENEQNSTFLSRGPRAQAMQGLFTPQSWPKNDKAIILPKLLNLEVQGDCSVSCVREIGRKDFGRNMELAKWSLASCSCEKVEALLKFSQLKNLYVL